VNGHRVAPPTGCAQGRRRPHRTRVHPAAAPGGTLSTPTRGRPSACSPVGRSNARLITSGDGHTPASGPHRVGGTGHQLDRRLRPPPRPRRDRDRRARAGPVTDLGAVATLKDYFQRLTTHARDCLDAGLTPLEAARATSTSPHPPARTGEADRQTSTLPTKTSAPTWPSTRSPSSPSEPNPARQTYPSANHDPPPPGKPLRGRRFRSPFPAPNHWVVLSPPPIVTRTQDSARPLPDAPGQRYPMDRRRLHRPPRREVDGRHDPHTRRSASVVAGDDRTERGIRTTPARARHPRLSARAR
jgi:hypothetical protein